MNNLHTGLIVVAKVKSIPFVKHVGVVLIENGNTYILHNTPTRGTVKDSYQDFFMSRNKPMYYSSNLVKLSNSEIIHRFNNVCQGSFRLLSYNCEHFVRCMLGTESQSPQLQKFFFRAIGLLAI